METTMKDVTYTITGFYGKALVVLDDPIWCHVWYLRNVRNGIYTWTRSALSAKGMTVKTAQKHIADLKGGADKDWPKYRAMWMN